MKRNLFWKRKIVFSLTICLTMGAAGWQAGRTEVSAAYESDQSPEPETAEPVAEETSEGPENSSEQDDLTVSDSDDAGTQVDTDALFGEAYDEFPDCFSVKGFLEQLPGNDGYTNFSITEERAVASFLRDGQLFAMEYSFLDQNARIIDFDISTDQYVIPEGSDMGLKDCRIYPAADGGFFYQFMNELKSFDKEGTLIHEFTLRTNFPKVFETATAECEGNTLYIYYPDGSEQEFALPAGSFMAPAGFYGDILLIEGYDEYMNSWCLDVDLPSGEIRKSSIMNKDDSITPFLYSRKLSDSSWMVADYRQDSFGFIYDLPTNLSPIMPYGNGFFAAGYEYTRGDGLTKCRASLVYYSSRQKNPVITKELFGRFGLNFDNAVIIGDCIIFFPYRLELSPELLIMRIGETEETGGEEPQKWQLNPGTGIEKAGNRDFYSVKDYSLATEVNTDYCSMGIGFYIGEDVLSTSFETCNVVPCDIEINQTVARQAILDYLALFPEGFLDEVIMPYEGFDIYLTGAIQAKNGTGNIAEGFTNEHQGRLYIVFNILTITDGTIRHEFLHAFEDAMNKIAGKGVFPDWNELNPPDFSYLAGYNDEYGIQYLNFDPLYNQYTIYSEQAADVENIWFIDVYAKTLPTEDRARLVEYAGSPNWASMPAFSSSHILAKLRVISNQLRSYFPSLQNAGMLPWEQPLGQIR